MFKKLDSLAQQAATRASRRQFLSRLAKGSAVVAAAVGGMLVTTQVAQAGRNLKCCPKRQRCRPPRKKGCKLIACVEVAGDFPFPTPGCRWDCGGTIIESECRGRGIAN